MAQTHNNRTHRTQVLLPEAGKQRGRPRKTDEQAEVAGGQRTALSLLPGQLVAKREIERELGEVRSVVGRGEHREWIALIPGLEMQLKLINEGLERVMGITLGSVGSGGAVSQVDIGEDGQEDGQDETATTGKRGNTFDISEALGARPLFEGKPTQAAVLLAELITQGEVDLNDFGERWVKYYPKITNRRSHAVRMASYALTKKGVRLRRKATGVFALASQPTGEWPSVVANHPWLLRALGQGNEQGEGQVLLGAAQTELTQAAEVTTPTKHTGLFEGTRTQILAQEFAAAPGHVLNFRELVTKYGVTGSEYAFHFAKTGLVKQGWKIVAADGVGQFRLVRAGRPV